MIREFLTRWLDRSIARRESRARQESFHNPVILSGGRDAVRYFDSGRVITIEVEWIGGNRFQVYSKGIVHWEGEPEPSAVTDEEKKDILEMLTKNYSKKRKILVESPGC